MSRKYHFSAPTIAIVAFAGAVGAIVAGASLAERSAYAADVNTEHHAVLLAAEHMETGNYLTEGDLRKQLAGQGYQVFEVEFEDGEVEAEVKKGGQTYELELDPKTGQVLSKELED